MDFNFEKEALIASGVRGKDRLVDYIAKLDHLHSKIISELKSTHDPIAKSRLLFEWLWHQKPSRYESHGHFRLNDVIDGQLKKDRHAAGNCLGLTLLYNCLLQRMNITAEALYLENAFGVGPHVLTLLQLGESMIDIENIFPDGFDYRGHLDKQRTKWGNRELVADLYHSAGNECFEKGEYIEALKNYDMAIKLNLHYEKAHLNKTILLDKMGRAND